jgi:hypothetical protein
VHGQLPFDTKGMDDVVPTIDFSPSGSKEPSYSLNREDIDGIVLSASTSTKLIVKYQCCFKS